MDIRNAYIWIVASNMKGLFVIIFFSFLFDANTQAFETIVGTTEKELIYMINRQNRSIVFSNNYKPSINSYYTKGRFEPSKKILKNWNMNYLKSFCLCKRFVFKII